MRAWMCRQATVKEFLSNILDSSKTSCSELGQLEASAAVVRVMCTPPGVLACLEGNHEPAEGRCLQKASMVLRRSFSSFLGW